LRWSATQGHILTGGGRLNEVFKTGRDFSADGSELPHTLKARGLPACRDTYRRWLSEGRRSQACVGAWSRPLFAGGWAESTDHDTAVFNLQTPSIFIDMRFPHALTAMYMPASFQECSLEQLRALSQQHCFAGYSLVEEHPAGSLNQLPICVRHHAIDWNYHPTFPRARPNKWRIETHPSGDGRSFKEWGFAQDPSNSQAVYFERWALLPCDGVSPTSADDGLSCSRGPCLALRRCAGVDSDRDAFLVVIGDHFAYARDRTHPLPTFPGATAGGCANLAEAAYQTGDRAALLALLDLEGSYGRVTGAARAWEIVQSTQPWRRGQSLFVAGECRPVFQPNAATGKNELSLVEWGGASWEVLECNFTPAEVVALFGEAAPAPTSKL